MSVYKEQQDVIKIVGTLKEILFAHVMLDISYITIILLCVLVWFFTAVIAIILYILFKISMSVWSPMEAVNMFVRMLLVAMHVHVIVDMYLEWVVTIVKVLVL